MARPAPPWTFPALRSVLAAIEPEAWMRLVVAVLGLVLALLAAVFSTVAWQAGNVLSSRVLALAALLIAAWVGITTVPFLARRMAPGRMREALDYRATKEGILYLLLTLAVAIAALNTGNNLLFMIVSAMLGAVIVSGVASTLVLRGVELEVALPDQVFAGTSVVGRVLLRNLRAWAPSISVSIVPLAPRPRRKLRLERAVFGFPPRRPRHRQWLRIPDYALRMAPPPAAPEAIFAGSIYFPYVPPRSTGAANLQLSFARRGRYAQEAFGVSTRFPFSFLIKTRRVRLARELIVYPPVEATDESLEVLPMITGEFASFVRGRGHDLYRIREYMPEDSARHVDWKATAKSGSVKVREFTREDERKLRIVFDNPAPGTLPPGRYEDAVSLTASLAWHFASENTELAFAAPGYAGSPAIYDFLRYLALVQPEPATALLDQLQLTDDYNLILTTRPRGTIPTPLWACSYVVFVAARMG